MPPALRIVIRLLTPLFLLSAAWAQTSSTVSGNALDTTGALIPHAHVTLQRADGAALETESDSSGQFHIANVKPGNYTLRIAADGFQTLEKPLAIPSQTRTPLRLTLAVMGAVADVNVNAEEQTLQVNTDTSNNQSATDVDRDALDRLPVFDGDYITTLSRFLSTDAVGTSGVTLVVNGAEANGAGVTASGVQSVRINQNPYTALYASPGRARIEITTKGGTDHFHGSLNALGRKSIFDARNPFARTKPAESRLFFEGAVTGPLRVGRKSTFLVTGNHDKNHQQAVVLAATPSGQVQTNVPNPTTHDFYSARAFHNFREADQFWIGYSYERRAVQNAGIGGTVLPEAGTDTRMFEHEINLGYTRVISPQLVNQLRFLVGKNENRVDSITSAPQVLVSGAFTGGGAQADFRRTENHVDGADIVTYTKGKHELKVGIDIPDISRRGFVDKTNGLGTYTFASLSSYAAGTPSLYVTQRGQPRVVFWETIFGGIVEDTVRLRPNLSISAGFRYYFQNYFHNVPFNVAPRLSFAYAPSTKGRTVIRGGAGLFYDRSGPSPISDLLHFDGVTLRKYIVSRPAYPFPGSAVAALPTSLATLDPRVRMPSTLQFSIGLEEQITRSSTLSVTYVGMRGMNLFRSIDANAPLEGTNIRPNPTFGQIRLVQPEGYAKGNSLEISFRGRPTSYFAGQVQYILSKSYNNTQGITWFPADSHTPLNDWARSDNDRRQKFDLLGTFTAKKWFSLGTALSLYSGLPVNIVTGSDTNGDGVANDRPTGIRRNALHGPGYVNVDFNLAHDFVLTKDKKSAKTLTVSINSFNVVNRVNPTTYVGVITSPFFGKPVAAQPPRRMQFNLQYKF
ncbi:TonB-dependent receptor [Terriglobus albidus]|uniref:TonB-dependent receptor n=1 Tax=Terriglobus albidus TaxID=1592106 RepID=UPI0021DFF3B6|nr:carboxypeptidase regulatory-like domain-containing protein [Terriglobus albidus]